MPFSMIYSEKEIALIRHYFPDQVEHVLSGRGLSAYHFYRMMAEKAFIENKNDIFDKSLRRCLAVLIDCTVRRLTPEFDALIDDGVLK
jgi:hypothetical protein